TGPLARRVDDLRLALEVMSGYSPEDPVSAPVPLEGSAFERRVVVVKSHDGLAIDPRIEADIDRAAAVFRAAGWSVEAATPPSLREAVELQIDLWFCDGFDAQMEAAQREGDEGALTALRRNRRQAERFDLARFSEVFGRRAALARLWRRFMADYPVVLMPVSAELPFKRDEDLSGDDALERIWQAQTSQIGLPLVGLPALSFATGVVDAVPRGVQLVAAPWREDVCLAAADVLELAFGVPAVAEPL
ncbi:MAG: amidase family protein, partial [Pseudomonadota bacterium]